VIDPPRPRYILIALGAAFVAGAAAVLLALYVALRTAPGAIMADDLAEVLAVVAEERLARFPRGAVVYVKSAAGPQLLQRLQPRYPWLTLTSYSARSESARCLEESLPAERCEPDVYLKLEVLAAPTRSSMLVAAATADTYGDVLLVRLFGRWRVIVDRLHTI